MALDRLNASLAADVAQLEREGRAKAPERVITGYVPAANGRGPRYRLRDSDGEYLRMNANSYLSLSNHPALIEAGDQQPATFGTGPGAVRFIDGTSVHHVALEARIAALRRPAGGDGLQLGLHDDPRHWPSRSPRRTRTGSATR